MKRLSVCVCTNTNFVGVCVSIFVCLCVHAFFMHLTALLTLLTSVGNVYLRFMHQLMTMNIVASCLYTFT